MDPVLWYGNFISIFVEGRGLWGHIDGSEIKPEETDV